jgi:LuxR family maltose regulon positive regulatory protein
MASRKAPPPGGVTRAAPGGDPNPRLFQARLRPPLDAARALPRARMPGTEALDQARLVLVTAPAGFGKTTALCQYERMLARANVRTGWLTIDPDDDDIARFSAYLRAALARCLPPAALRATAAPAPPPQPPPNPKHQF